MILPRIICRLFGHRWGRWQRSLTQGSVVRDCQRCEALEYTEQSCWTCWCGVEGWKCWTCYSGTPLVDVGDGHGGKDCAKYVGSNRDAEKESKDA